jgi:hypothetical protein
MATPRRLTGFLTATTLLCLALPAGAAHATIRVQNHNDPAGDPMVAAYTFVVPGGDPIDFSLADGADRSFGPVPGTYVVQSRLPAGWQVADIQCAGLDPAAFAIDVAHGKVTITHTSGAEQTCSFTNRRSSGSTTAPGTTTPPAGGGATAGAGVAPTPGPGELPASALPQRAALLRVEGGRSSAVATLRLVRLSVVRAQLLWHGTRAVGSTRVVRDPGTHTVRVRLTKAGRQLLLRQGRRRVTLTLRVVVVPVRGATRVFTFGVLVAP